MPRKFTCSRFWRLLALGLVTGLMAQPVLAQGVPYHIDPSTREVLPDVSAVPAIRFLTTADFPPFNYRDGAGNLIGYNVDLARAICGELKIACTIQAWPWDQVTEALAGNQGDALLAGLAIMPENGEKFDFSGIYMMLPGRFVTRLDGVETFDATRLSGKTIAVRKGTSHEEFLSRYLPGASIATFDSEVTALEAVRDRKADAYFGDAMRASFWLNDVSDCCAFAGEAYFRPDLFGEGMAVAVPAGRDAIRQAVDYALVKLKEAGTLDELYLRWFPVSFY